MAEHIRTLEAVMEAWKRGDVEAVLERVDDEVVYHYHVGSKPIEGKAAMRRFLEKFGQGQKDVRWRIVRHAQQGDALLVEGIDDYVDAEGRRIRTPYMGSFALRDGRIREWRDYLDPAWIQRAKAEEPLAPWMAQLVADARGSA